MRQGFEGASLSPTWRVFKTRWRLRGVWKGGYGVAMLKKKKVKQKLWAEEGAWAT